MVNVTSAIDKSIDTNDNDEKNIARDIEVFPNIMLTIFFH